MQINYLYFKKMLQEKTLVIKKKTVIFKYIFRYFSVLILIFARFMHDFFADISKSGTPPSPTSAIISILILPTPSKVLT